MHFTSGTRRLQINLENMKKSDKKITKCEKTHLDPNFGEC